MYYINKKIINMYKVKILGDILRNLKIFIINVGIMTITSSILQLVGIIFNIYISNKIGSEGVGLFSLIMSVYTFGITLASFGINLASTKIVANQMAFNNKNGAIKVLFQCIFLSFIVGTLASFLLYAFSDIIINVCLKNKISKLPLYICFIALPFISMSASINGYFNATRKVYKTASASILEQIIKIFLAFTLLDLLLPKGLEYACISLIIATCISEMSSFFYSLLLIYLEKRKLKYKKNNENYFKEIFRICVPIGLTSYIRSGLSTFKQLIIPLRLEKSGLSTSASISAYGIVNGMVMPLLLFPSVFINSFANLLVPEFSRIYATKNSTRISTITNKIFKYTFLFSACIFSIFITFYNKLSNILYNEALVAKFLLILSPLVIIIYIDTVVDGILKGLDEQVNVMKCNILDLFTSITLIYFLVPIMGIYGYIVVIYVSELLNGIISIYLLVRKTKVKFKFTQYIIKPVGIALLARYIFIFIIKSIGLKFNIFIEILIFISFYILLLFISRTIKKSDFKV